MTEITSILEVDLEGHEQKQGIRFRVPCSSSQATGEDQTRDYGCCRKKGKILQKFLGDKSEGRGVEGGLGAAMKLQLSMFS